MNQKTYNWKDIKTRHPAWFKELFRWLKDRNDGSYAMVIYGMKHHPYFLSEGIFHHYIEKKNMLSWLFLWVSTEEDLNLHSGYFQKLYNEWTKFCCYDGL